jgi:hypothetical protein
MGVGWVLFSRLGLDWFGGAGFCGLCFNENMCSCGF